MKSFLITMILSMVIFFSGCAILQPKKTGGSLANLPTTGTQAMFQTLKGNNWLFTLSFVGVGAGFFAFLNGSSKGLQFMAACLLVLSLIIGITKYSAIIAAITMIGTVSLMGYSMWIRKKAIKEVVQGVQNVRNLESLDGHVNENDLLLRPKEVITTYLDNVQSKTTKKIVKTIKNALKL